MLEKRLSRKQKKKLSKLCEELKKNKIVVTLLNTYEKIGDKCYELLEALDERNDMAGDRFIAWYMDRHKC